MSGPNGYPATGSAYHDHDRFGRSSQPGVLLGLACFPFLLAYLGIPRGGPHIRSDARSYRTRGEPSAAVRPRRTTVGGSDGIRKRPSASGGSALPGRERSPQARPSSSTTMPSTIPSVVTGRRPPSWGLLG